MLGKTRRGPDPDEIVRRLEVLERQFKALETEWSDMYDKLRRLLMRLSKRDQRDRAAEDAPQSTNGDQVPISLGAQILMRGR